MVHTIDSILVPTDGSERARAGVQRGIDLATTLGADLHALSVINTREIEPSMSRLDADERSERERQFEAEAQDIVDDVAQLARPHLSGSVTTAVERGVPFQTITDYAETHDIDLIAMGTHGRTGLQRVLLGSVTEKTLRTTSVPVLAVPPDAGVVDLGAVTYEDVLVPTDGSEGAALAVDWGVTFAALYDASVHTVYSVDTSRFLGVDGVAELHDALEATGRDALEAVSDHAQDAGVSVMGHIGSGPAARVILSYAEDHDVDLLVMGTHGRSGVHRYLLGSVTETVVRNAEVPVCCVPMA